MREQESGMGQERGGALSPKSQGLDRGRQQRPWKEEK